MDNNLAYIDDFIEIETQINNKAFETSHYSSLRDFFYSHLENCNINDNIKLEGIDVFKIKVGDQISISPTEWSIKFSKKHDLPYDPSYDFKYEVENIILKFYSINPNSDSGIPRLDIKIKLNKI